MTDKGRAGLVEKTWAVAWRGSGGESTGLGGGPLGWGWLHTSAVSLFVNSECGQVRASWLCSYTLEPERLLLCVPYWESL